MLDKTLSDSFPASNPLSTIPDPGAEDPLTPAHKQERLFAGLAPGAWVALSVDNREVLATGATRHEAEQMRTLADIAI